MSFKGESSKIKEKTLFISDLDGTLLNGAAELSEYTKNTLNALIAEGLNFSVATARAAVFASAILADVKWNMPLVLMNGVAIYDLARKKYIQTYPFDAETARTIVETLKELNVGVATYQLEGDTIYFSLSGTYEEIRRVQDSLSPISGMSFSIFEDVYNPKTWYIEIHSDKASKRNGVDFLRRAYGFDRVIGFGDNINDLSMFMACDVRIAVENAKPEVKAAADYICGSNENDGVARWITGRLHRNSRYR